MYDIFEAHFSRYCCYMRMTIQKKAPENANTQHSPALFIEHRNHYPKLSYMIPYIRLTYWYSNIYVFYFF